MMFFWWSVIVLLLGVSIGWELARSHILDGVRREMDRDEPGEDTETFLREVLAHIEGRKKAEVEQ